MRIQKNRKGQAALEFLTTYGWAFLVILIMIAALAYFGVLSPSSFLPERCNLPAGYVCEDFRITNTGANTLQLEMQVTNQQGSALTLGNFQFDNQDGVTGTTGCTWTSSGGVTSSTLSSGTTDTVTCTADFTPAASPPAGEKQRLSFSMNSTPVGGGFVKLVQGEVFGTIQ